MCFDDESADQYRPVLEKWAAVAWGIFLAAGLALYGTFFVVVVRAAFG